jgi:hypothetical protein
VVYDAILNTKILRKFVFEHRFYKISRPTRMDKLFSTHKNKCFEEKVGSDEENNKGTEKMT